MKLLCFICMVIGQSILISSKVRSFVRSFVCHHLPHSGGSKIENILVNISGNSCSGLKMVPKLEEGRRGGDVASLESVTRLSFDC